MVKTIAFYLPQFHPIPENDEWYGAGFTEWTNVAKAKPLFRGHYQPHIPADLGFYDLRLEETRRAQSELALQYGISAFCYWHYWFGNGKQLLEMPIWKMHEDPAIKIPFCIAWANESWQNKLWDSKGNNKLLIEQQYLGAEDYKNFFYTLLPLFKDYRYYRIDDKLLFIVHRPLNCKDDEMKSFIETWRQLAQKENIGDFYFIGEDKLCANRDKILNLGFDATVDVNLNGIVKKSSFLNRARLHFARSILHHPSIFQYKKAIKFMVTDSCKEENIFPTIAPNWDHSPRSGRKALLFDNCEPRYFQKLIEKTLDLIKHKDPEHQIVFIKSWNEWGEGNYLEPDLKYGRGYLEDLKKVLKYK